MTQQVGAYTGWDLAIGSICATRWFDVDEWGRLRGVARRHVWTPGENVAECRKDEDWSINSQLYKYLWSADPLYAQKPAPTPPPKPSRKHTSPHETCSCGFYAYAEGCDDGSYGNNSRALGVIEVYGRVIVGTKGVRAEKARVVGLRVKPQHEAQALLRELYPDVLFFENRAEMYDGFDLVQRYRRTPENDPEFWTRP